MVSVTRRENLIYAPMSTCGRGRPRCWKPSRLVDGVGPAAGERVIVALRRRRRRFRFASEKKRSLMSWTSMLMKLDARPSALLEAIARLVDGVGPAVGEARVFMA